ncbi:MAG: M20/M25/M40 family metallo-hydrolase [Phycisphaerales bacterium]
MAVFFSHGAPVAIVFDLHEEMIVTIEKALEAYAANRHDGVDRLVEWLSIPSISTDPAYRDECRRGGQWLVDQLTEIGLDAKLETTPGHPIVWARTTNPEAHGPHILFYGHYDVQPADPLEKWKSPPFEPAIVDGPHGKRVVARGAVDDKGQVMTFIEALRAWKDATGSIPCPVTVIVEGEEESASVNLDAFLERAKARLVGNEARPKPCDLVVVSDTGMWDINTPAITTSLRGLLYLEVTVHGPSHDLHSGMAGGAVPNPANELARVIGEIHDENRRVTIDAFYDDVVELTPEQRREWASLEFDEAAYLSDMGVSEARGERDFSTLERQWARPTCDVNGIYGGYTGVGAKTIIPSHASAKISFRLVPDQRPEKIESAFKQWFESRLPRGLQTEWRSHGSGRAYRVEPNSPYLQTARSSLERATGVKPVNIGSGGSIPVVESIKQTLGLDTLLIGFGLADDRVHSPNEKFELRCFEMGAQSHIVLLGEFAKLGGE